MQLLFAVLLCNIIAPAHFSKINKYDSAYVLDIDDDCEKDAKDQQTEKELEKETEKDKITYQKLNIVNITLLSKKEYFINHDKLTHVFLDQDHLPPLV